MDIRYAVRVFAFKDNKVACIKYKNINKDYFDIPGGKIEDGETEIQTCIREFKEETNLEKVLEYKENAYKIIMDKMTKEMEG